MDKIFEITAKEVTVQVKDERTGVVYNAGRFPSIIMRMQMF